MAEAYDVAVADLFTEHLQYSPTSFIDDIINTMNELANKAIDAVEAALLTRPPEKLGFVMPKTKAGESDEEAVKAVTEKARFEVDNGVHQLETLLAASVDKNFDIMEIYILRNIFSVKEELKGLVRLSHYDGLNFNASTAADAPTTESINLLRRKLQETQKLHHLLVSETSKNAALITHLRTLLYPSSSSTITTATSTSILPTDPSPSSLSTSTSTSTPRHPITLLRTAHGLGTTTSFALSQLPQLKTLLAALRPPLAALSADGVGGGRGGSGRDARLAEQQHEDDNKSFRRRRREYIEAQTRRYLEAGVGLELGRQGEVRDGEWTGGGRRLGRDEVEALERVVGDVVAGREGGTGGAEAATAAASGEEMDES